MAQASTKQIRANQRTAKTLQKQGRGLWSLSAEERSALSRRTGRKVGRRLYKEGRGIFAMTPAQQTARSRKAGRKSGRIAADTGRVVEMGKIGGKLGGVTQGNVNASNGHLEYCTHVRWHVNRDRLPTSKYCRFCDSVIAYA
jgi:hypothetical protein